MPLFLEIQPYWSCPSLLYCPPGIVQLSSAHKLPTSYGEVCNLSWPVHVFFCSTFQEHSYELSPSAGGKILCHSTSQLPLPPLPYITLVFAFRSLYQSGCSNPSKSTRVLIYMKNASLKISCIQYKST